jgi:CrcB protein
MNLLFVALGGSAGAIARYCLGTFINSNVNAQFPYGTLFVNVTGSFVIGFLFAMFERLSLPNELKLLLITGFLGAYTTFSSYSLETVRLAMEGKMSVALVNFLLNNGLCLACTVAGMAASASLLKR